ncbi:holin-like protein [Amphibacillus marinus]|uniref:Holin-like protein n=1 Tax=Amphibacillus marinus TaxID=872970 RepID=A0A1H8QU45_9BACI|nr:CidA/LrgA family protein [Amphibacillus marinus]SEO57448.1 holin-like protein [Amphibacillus marinus]
MNKVIRILVQVAIIHIFFFAAIGVKAFLPIPLPTTIVGLLLLFFALLVKLVKIEWVEEGGRWLMAELLLFFIPSAVGIVNYNELAGVQGFFIVLIIAISTIIVLGVTALLIEKWEVNQS